MTFNMCGEEEMRGTQEHHKRVNCQTLRPRKAVLRIRHKQEFLNMGQRTDPRALQEFPKNL